MSATPFLRSAGYVLAIAVALVAGIWALPAGAADTTVELHDNEFRPPNPSVAVGDTITWSWVGDNPHSVRVQTVDGTTVYDSHPECSSDTTQKCGTKPLATTWTPEAAGTFTFHCRVHATMTGTLTVDPAPSPSASPSSSPSSTSSTSPSPSPSPTPTQEPEPEPTTGSQPEPEPTEDTTEEPAVQYGPPEPMETQPLPTILPSGSPTASPTPTEDGTPELEAFPEARDASPTASEEPGVVAIDSPGGPSPRVVWLGIGSVSVLTAAGAFSKLVLFGAPWT
ncbi:MAG: plastocyanin/azurin family copper-binding protein [Nitriliruptorales bacterium]|nr:plastocyanin/azurin family copper-binding protein [Nitriliruptorales bacterium]